MNPEQPERVYLSPEQMQQFADAHTKTQAMIADMSSWMQLLVSVGIALVIVLVVKIMIHVGIALKLLATNSEVLRLLEIIKAEGKMTDRAKDRIGEAADRVEAAAKLVSSPQNGGGEAQVVPHGPRR